MGLPTYTRLLLVLLTGIWLTASSAHASAPRPAGKKQAVAEQNSKIPSPVQLVEKLPLPEPKQPAPIEEPLLIREGYQLILDYEVGGGERYYNRFLKRPTWPGYASGVTVGVGYDLGYNTRSVILMDWEALEEANRLAAVSGVKGKAAKARVDEVRDILIQWELAEEVFNKTTLVKFWNLTARKVPGFLHLRPNAQAALVSLGFNRGWSLSGDRRKEMREIVRLAPKADYNGMAYQIRKMKRIWKGSSVEKGLSRRREAEARLMETP